MNISYNRDLFKIANSDMPLTYETFIHETLPQSLSLEMLPEDCILSYWDLKSRKIRVMNQINYNAMLQVMSQVAERYQDELDFSITLSQTIKLEEEADVLLIKNANPAHPVVDEIASVHSHQNPQSNEEPAQNNLEAAGNNHQANRPPMLNHHAAEEEAPAQVTENPFTHENVEWIINEDAAWKEGLSERIEIKKAEIQKKQKQKKRNSSQKKSRNKGSNLRKEAESLEKNSNIQKESCENPQRGQWKDLEDRLEKKIKTSPISSVGVPQGQSNLNENLDKFREKWKKNYNFLTDFKRGFLKVTVLQEPILDSKCRPNRTITDENVKNMMNDLLVKLKDFKITNLALNFENCLNLSKAGVSSLFLTLNRKFFKNIQGLILDFSFNRCDITQEETIKIIESIGKNSKDSLKSFNFFLSSGLYEVPKLTNEIKSKLNFVEDHQIFPLSELVEQDDQLIKEEV